MASEDDELANIERLRFRVGELEWKEDKIIRALREIRKTQQTQLVKLAIEESAYRSSVLDEMKRVLRDRRFDCLQAQD